MSQSATRIARLWLNSIRRTQSIPNSRAPVVSSDDDSNDSSAEGSGQQLSSAAPGLHVPSASELSVATKQIMGLWMATVRQ